MSKLLKFKHPVVSQLERTVREARPFDHDLEGALGQYLSEPSDQVADKVIETLYGLNGDGVPYFVEKLAPHLGLDPKNIDKNTIDTLIGKYGIVKETLKSIITAKDVFDAATVSQITTQLANQLVADMLQGAAAQIGNLAYRNRDAAVDVIAEIQGFLGGPNAAANIKKQLSTALTPDRIQALAAGVIENAYQTYKGATPNLYRAPVYEKQAA